jgi:transcriptional regulator with GAF, ATPase, and Fis domain
MVLAYLRKTGDIMGTLKDKIEELEKEEIIKALRDCGWVMARAARSLGITERMIGYKIQKYGIRTKEVRWLDQKTTGEIGKP